MKQEQLADSFRTPSGFKPRLRSAARHLVLDMLSLVSYVKQEKNVVRCVMMHYVFDDQRAEFEAHIKSLLGLGDFITTDNLIDMLEGKAPVDGRYFHLSFDDGLDCLARNAAPILDQHAVPAIVFVNSAVCNAQPEPEDRSAWEQHTNYKRPLSVMSWKTLANSGFEVGAHTRTHKRLSDMSTDEALMQREINDCKTEIESRLNKPCNYFAWPYGNPWDIDAASTQAVKDAGFKASFSATRGTVKPLQTDAFAIPRHHMEPQWPVRHAGFFASGGLEPKQNQQTSHLP